MLAWYSTVQCGSMVRVVHDINKPLKKTLDSKPLTSQWAAEIIIVKAELAMQRCSSCLLYDFRCQHTLHER